MPDKSSRSEGEHTTKSHGRRLSVDRTVDVGPFLMPQYAITRTIPANNNTEEEISMLTFILGLMLGGSSGVVVMCLMFVAGEEDRRMERLADQKQRKQPNP